MSDDVMTASKLERLNREAAERRGPALWMWHIHRPVALAMARMVEPPVTITATLGEQEYWHLGAGHWWCVPADPERWFP